MEAKVFVDAIESALGVESYFGVPDSLLRPLCDEVYERYGVGGRHVVAANEGGAVALAAGHYLATGKPACVYMQNSGIGNAINPICSLLNERVYAIPALFVVGWRGEPGVHDEPQHVFQGACSEDLLEVAGLSVHVIDDSTDERKLAEILAFAKERMDEGRSCGLLVRKGALSRTSKHAYVGHDTPLTRERAVEVISSLLPDGAVIVSTTGKLSRELFEIRERRGESHATDFLTVGSMGHASMIGAGVALAQPGRPVVVLDGDGAAIMHMGSMATLPSLGCSNIVHVLINNEAHDSVGGMPTVSAGVDWPCVARACGYFFTVSAEGEDGLHAAMDDALGHLGDSGPVFAEVKVNLSSRSDLGRPTTSAYDNGRAFMGFLARENVIA